MAKFDAALTKKKFNAAVVAHKKVAPGATQIRHKITSIGPRLKLHEGRNDYRVLKYASGDKFTIDESSLAGLVHAYTLHVALLTGDFALVLLPFDLEPPAGAARAMSPYATMGIRIGMGFLFASFKSKQGKKDSEEISKEIHDGIRDAHPKFCKK